MSIPCIIAFLQKHVNILYCGYKQIIFFIFTMASQVHRVRYYKPKPETINCVSFNKNKKLLALARVDTSIELWDLNYAPYMVQFIPGTENGSVEALCWVKDRLLSTGLIGSLVEWDLKKLTVKNTVLLTGYAAWCLDVNPENTMVAVGTEQGYINIFNVEHGDIVYSKLFDKQEGRIMCCKFDKTGNLLVTGSPNSIRVWNTQTGHAITRMSVTKRDSNTIVWCLAVLSDNIIVSGDSHGRLIFWDSALGDQIESYKTHKSDILAIAVSDDEEHIYCSGVDPVIMSYQKVNKSSDKGVLQWMKNVQRHIHEHDVRALVMNDQKLISVGNDGYLSLSSFPPKWVKRVPPMIPGPRSSVSVEKRLLLLRYSKHLEVWRLGAPVINEQGQLLISHNNEQQTSIPNGGNYLELDSTEAYDNGMPLINNRDQRILQVDKNPVKLVSIQTKKKKQIRCCELSPSGEIIVYATDSDIRMLKLDTDDDESNTFLSKMVVTGVPMPCNRIVFTEDSRCMIVHSAGALQVLQVDPGAGATPVQTIKTDKHMKSSSILHLLVKTTPSKKTYLVAADTEGAIAVWSHTGHKFEHYATLPTYSCVPSAMAVDAARESLLITYVDQKLAEYKLADKKFEEWPRTGLPPSWYERESAVQGITAHPARDAIVFHDETSLWVMERPSTKNQTESYDGPEAKRHPNKTGPRAQLKVIPIKYLAGFHWLEVSEAVSIEVLPESIVSQLPATCVKTRNFNVG